MGKIMTSIKIDEDLHKEAKSKFLNISKATEDGLKAQLGKTEVTINTQEPLHCEFCGKEGTKETAQDVEPITNVKDPVKFPNLLTWLWPDEKWICNGCLRSLARKVPIGH